MASIHPTRSLTVSLPGMIYLDHNATTPLRPAVFAAMHPFLTERWGNPSSSYAFGSQLKSVIEAARSSVAALLGASSREIVFTGSATESNNTALHAALSADPAKRHIVTSAVEHSAVLNHTIFLEKLGYRVTRGVSPIGQPAVAQLPGNLDMPDKTGSLALGFTRRSPSLRVNHCAGPTTAAAKRRCPNPPFSDGV